MRKLRTGDNVIVITGKNSGSKGIIKKILKSKIGKSNRKTGEVKFHVKAVVEGLNLVSKCERANPEKGIEGGIKKIEAPIDISNLAIVNPRTGKADKVGFKLLTDGKKVRFFKSDGEVIEASSAAK